MALASLHYSVVFLFAYCFEQVFCALNPGLSILKETKLSFSFEINRLDDYHHHAGDVFSGSFIGICFSFLAYRQYYPALNSKNCHRCYAELKNRELLDFPSKKSKTSPQLESKAFLEEEKDTKWI